MAAREPVPGQVAPVVALAASLFVSLTVVPVLASWFMRPTPAQAARLAETPDEHDKETWLQKSYLPVLNWALAHRAITVLIALGIFAGTLMVVPAFYLLLAQDHHAEAAKKLEDETTLAPAGHHAH